jgi:hypothetical protein
MSDGIYFYNRDISANDETKLIVTKDEKCRIKYKKESISLSMYELFNTSYVLNIPIKLRKSFLKKYGFKITKKLLLESLYADSGISYQNSSQQL